MTSTTKASIVRAVKLETQFQQSGHKFYRRTKFYHTASSASSAAEAYADYMSAKVNAQRHALAKKTGTTYVPADGYTIVLTGNIKPTSHYPVHDAAYRRSLRIFKQFLP